MKNFIRNRYNELSALDKTTIVYAAALATVATLAISLINHLDESNLENQDGETKED